MIIIKNRVMQLRDPSRRGDGHSRAVDANIAAEPAACDRQPGHVRMDGATPAPVIMTRAAHARDNHQDKQPAQTGKGMQQTEKSTQKRGLNRQRRALKIVQIFR